MNSFFLQLFEYDNNCNTRLIDVMVQNEAKLSPRCLDVFSHMLNAHRVWNNRIAPKDTLTGIWERRELDKLAEWQIKNFEDSKNILNTFDLNNDVVYTTTSGKSFTHQVKDLLFQVISHSAYHRGQIAIEFRNAGVEPLMTDYIYYKMST